MTADQPFTEHGNTGSALQAHQRGFVPIPVHDGAKRPRGIAWERTKWASAADVKEHFDRAHGDGAGNVGLLLGEPSGGLVDIDLDHPKAIRLRDDFVPPTAMISGRAGRARSHHWFKVTTDLPSTRKYTMPDGATIVEIRSTGAQTVIPPSTHPSGEAYRWESEPWGDPTGPAEIGGDKLVVQIGMLAMASVLLDGWPTAGQRHDAYLALAGGLLRLGDGVHPWWERNLPSLIRALAVASLDHDGPTARVHEVMRSTLERLREGREATGFHTLAKVIGDDHVKRVRKVVRDIETAAHTVSRDGFSNYPIDVDDDDDDEGTPVEIRGVDEALPEEELSPLEERATSWDAVPLDRYLIGDVVIPEPTVLRRADGRGLMYAGKVNLLFGRSESAKSWLALLACQQEIEDNGRVLYLDFEDMPETTVGRLRRLSTGVDDIAFQFRYVHPEEPISDLQRYAYKGDQPSAAGIVNHQAFKKLLKSFNPSLIIADGVTSLYGLHGHSTNDAGGTDVINTWLKKLTRHGRTSVVLIDHTGKGELGTGPIGAHHKLAAVQGSAIRADVIDQPMPDAIGRMELIVTKDRPGAVRQAASKDREQKVGMAVLDSTDDKVSTLVIELPDPAKVTVDVTAADLDRQATTLRKDAAEKAKAAAAAQLQERVLALFTPDVWLLAKDLVPLLYGPGDVNPRTRKELRDAWHELVAGGFLERDGDRKGTRLRLVDLSGLS